MPIKPKLKNPKPQNGAKSGKTPVEPPMEIKPKPKPAEESIPETAPPPKEVVSKQPSKEPPSEEPKKSEFVGAALMSARYWLAQREVGKAKEMVALAKKNDRDAADAKEITAVEALTHYVDQFWKAVRDECKSLSAGSQVTLRDIGSNKEITVGVVETGADYIVLRRAGVNERHVFKEMKSGVAFGLAELYLKKNDPVTHIVLGAFLAVNPKSNRDQARGQWETALQIANEELKAEVRLLLPELDVAIPDKLPKLPSVSSKETGKAKKSSDGRQAIPQGDALAKAQTALDSKYKQQLAAAVFEADKVALSEKLVADAEGAEADLRYALLTKASELAAEGSNFKIAYDAIDTLEKTHAVNGLALKVKAVSAGVKAASTPEANKAAAAAALALADEAVLLEKYAEAMALVVHARDAARKSKDSSLLKQASMRDTEIRALKQK